MKLASFFNLKGNRVISMIVACIIEVCFPGRESVVEVRIST